MADEPMQTEDTKLTRTKRKWAEEGRFLTGQISRPGPEDRLPPGQHLVKNWPVLDPRYDNDWTGVTTHDFLDAVDPKPEATAVMLTSYDGYTTNLLLSDFAAEDAVLVHRWQGEPLTAEHGGPVRLVVPHLYFWKSAKWLKRIDLLSADSAGFWEKNGYHMRGDPWAEERYSED